MTQHPRRTRRSNPWRNDSAGSDGASQSRKDEDFRYWQRWFDELWNKKNYDIVYEYVHPDFTAHGAGGQQIKMGPEGPKDMVKAWHAAMPDGKMTIDDVVTEGDLSTIRMTLGSDPYGNLRHHSSQWQADKSDEYRD